MSEIPTARMLQAGFELQLEHTFLYTHSFTVIRVPLSNCPQPPGLAKLQVSKKQGSASCVMGWSLALRGQLFLQYLLMKKHLLCVQSLVSQGRGYYKKELQCQCYHPAKKLQRLHTQSDSTLRKHISRQMQISIGGFTDNDPGK